MAKRPAKTGRPQTEAERAREERWRGILEEQKTSGLSNSAFCRQKKISANAYFWWKREVRLRDQRRRRGTVSGREERRSLVPVRIESTSILERSVAPGSFEIVLPNQRLVRVPAGFDVESLKRLIAVLEGASC